MTSQPLQKPLYLLKRLPTISHQEFGDHWFNVHAALLKTIPQFQELRSAYVQNHLLGPDPREKAPFPYDGVTQVYVRPEAASKPAFPEIPVFRERVIPDEETFLDRPGSIVLKTHEHVVLPGKADVKVLIFHRRKPGLSLAEFTEAWSTSHSNVVMAQPDFVAELRGYRQNHLIPGTSRYLAGQVVPGSEDFDGASEFWFGSAEAAKKAFGTKGYREAIWNDGARLFDYEREVACLVDPRQITPD